MIVTRARNRRIALVTLGSLAALISLLVASLWIPARASAGTHSCGTYHSDSVYQRARVFAVAGVGCHRALRVAKRFDHQGHAPGAWKCFLGHGGRRLFSCGYPPPAGGGPITGAEHALLARGVGAQASLGDRKPPQFAGLSSATTCIPGPISPDPSRNTRFHLSWSPASDDGTPQSEIVYDVFQSSKPGGEDYSAATYTSDPGATSFSTPALSSANSWYFVVRARDRAGNRDSNRVERLGENLCL